MITRKNIPVGAPGYMSASQIASALWLVGAGGHKPFQTPVEVWRDIRGDSGPDEPTEAQMDGHELEEPVARMYARRTGKRIRSDNRAYVLDDWLIGHVDRRFYGDPGGLECKAWQFAGLQWGEPGTNQVPTPCLAQVLTYLHLTAAPYWDVAALLGGRFNIYTIDARPRAQAELVAAAREWYRRHIIEGEPPKARAITDARILWPRSLDGKATEVSEDVVRALRELRDVRRRGRDLEAIESRLKLMVFEAAGDAEVLLHAGECVAKVPTVNGSKFRRDRATKLITELAGAQEAAECVEPNPYRKIQVEIPDEQHDEEVA